MSCEDCIKVNESKAVDKRCEKFQDEAIKKGKETGVCYQAPEDGPAVSRKDRERLDPDHAACNALFEEAGAKCDALPPAGPDDWKQLSGSAVYKDGKLVMIDGKPVCPPSKK